MLIGGALTWLVLIGVERGRGAWWPWLAYGLIAALGLYVHFFVALVVAAHGLWLLVTRQVPGWRGIAAGGIPLLLAAAPIPLIIVQFGGEHGWIPPLNLPRFYGAVVELTGSLWLLIGLTALLVVAAVLRRRDPRIWLLIASVLLPIAAVAVVSLFKPFFIPRYLIMVLPMLAVLASVALVAVRPVLLRVVLVAALFVALVLAAAVRLLERDQHPTGARRAAWIADEAQPGDRVVMQSWFGSPLEYYLHRASPTTELVKTDFDQALFGGEERVWLAVTGKRQGEIRETVLLFLDRYQVVDARNLGARGRLFLLEPIDDAHLGRFVANRAALIRSRGSSQPGRIR